MTERELNDIMEFDHVIRVGEDGSITVPDPHVYAPEVYVNCDDDGQISRQDDIDMMDTLFDAGWTVLNGWSGQSGYAGPIMHPSEYIGGALENHIRETPGVYVAVAVETLDDSEDAAGWMVLRQND